MDDKTSVIAYLSSALTLWLGTVDWNTVFMIGGFLIGLSTFGVNWYYKHKNTRLYQESIQTGVKAHAPKE